MTKNNLQQSLVWLLRQSHASHLHLDHTNLPAVSSSPVADDGRFEASQDMARLQLAPHTGTRSRLVGRNEPSTGLPTPDASRSSKEPTHLPPPASARPPRLETPLQRPAPQQPKTPASAYADSVFDDDILDIDDIEQVDLTSGDPNTSSFATFGTPERLWDEDAATRIWPLSDKRGKKRKSDEYQEDLVSPRPRQGSPKRKGPSVQVNSTAFQPEIPPDDFDDEEDVSLTQKPLPMSTIHGSPVRQTSSAAPDYKGKTAVRKHVWSEQEKTSIRPGPRSMFGESVPDSDDEDMQSPVRKEEPESTQRLMKIEEPRSSQTPAYIGRDQRSRVTGLPGPANLKTQRESTPNLNLQFKHNSSPCQQKLPTPPAEPDNPMVGPGCGIANPSSSDGVKLSAAEQEIVTKLMESGAEGIQAFLQRLENSRKDTNVKYADFMAQGDEVPGWLKDQRKAIAQRITAATRLLQLHASYANIIREKNSCKARLLEMLNNDEDVENSTIYLRTKELKAEGHAQEVAILSQMRAAGLEDRSPSSSAVDCQVTTSRVNRSGILVASTQKVPRCSPPKMSQQSPSRRYDSGCQSVVQTPMPNMSARRNESLSVRETNPTLKSRTESPTKLHRLPQPQFRRENSTSLVSGPTEYPSYGTNMGSPSRSYFPDDNFDDFIGDDDDILDMANDFEQGHGIEDSRLPFQSTPRAPLREMSDNVRRGGPAPPSPLKWPSASQQSHPWSLDVSSALRKRFHLQGFRHNQLEAINATLGGEDAFVLMPTGGGKSLCYQLPSIIQSGKTKGVTIVISPLLSLMQDQVDHLQKLRIQAFLINSEVTADHRKMVLQALNGPNPEKLIQLLYVTPEMLSKSTVINGAMDSLHKRGKLARIVIDEAHCVSQWGHDFRPDYKDIGNVRNRFRGVPAMALTATATENVKVDVMHNLGMDGCQVFTQSFNRPNLSYEVRPKGRGLDGIAQLILQSYPGQTGIIYCLSRKNCEVLAEKLEKEYSIKAAHYHAGLEPQQKADVQRRWQEGDYKVIVATIAFGMGIDKPDVRFVIHHSIPKSLEGYYQETGRAGRDGKQSGCYLYYNYGDTVQLKRMINESEGSEEQKERQRQMLRNVVQFCENRSDCRRVQVLAYFNERFTAEQCKNSCDNCNSNSVFETLDLTEHARHATDLVRQIHQDEVTLLHCVDVYRGAKITKISNRGHDQLEQYGMGQGLERGDCERLFQRLVTENVLEEYQKTNKKGFTSGYIKLGRNVSAVARGQLNLKMQVRISPNGKNKTRPAKTKRKKAGATGVRAATEDYPASTNVSSPLQPRSRPSRRKLVAESDSEKGEDHIDDFEPVRNANEPVRAKKRQSGPPITLDERLESLDDAHRHILNSFVEEARKLVTQAMTEKSLRTRPVADAVLREIAIEFPSTKQSMLEIHGMTEDKYRMIGPQLLKLAKHSYVDYRAIVKELEGVLDKAHGRDVVEISDDEHDFVVSDGDIESDGDEDEDESEHSRYFSANGDADVEQFSNQMSQIRTFAPASKATASFKKQGGRSSSGSSSFRKGRSGKKGSGSARTYKARAAGAGVRKKKASAGSRSSGGNATISAYATKKSGAASRGTAAGGIGMMPT